MWGTAGTPGLPLAQGNKQRLSWGKGSGNNPIAGAASEGAAASSSAALSQDTGSAPVTTPLLPAEKILHWSIRKSPVCCVQPVSNPAELQRGRCTGRRTAGFKNSSHRMVASAPACSAFPHQLCSSLNLGDFPICCVSCTVIFQCRLIAIVTAPGRREDYLINVCEALLDPHMKSI